MKILILAGPYCTTNYLYNAIKEKFSNVELIVESKPSIKAFYRHRIKKLGALKASGQFAFQIYSRIVASKSSPRIKQLETQFNLDPSAVKKYHHVTSANSQECQNLIKSIRPDLVVLNGTRIIKQSVLSLAPIYINIHTGITPKYRGVHGGYWALINKDYENCGVTIHQVDKGVDTGKVIWQGPIKPEASDNILTYPTLQYGVALPEIMKIVELIKTGEVLSEVDTRNCDSQQYYHPTLWQYLIHLWFHGIG